MLIELDLENNSRALSRLLAAARNWRASISPNSPVNMTPHERELAEAIDELSTSCLHCDSSFVPICANWSRWLVLLRLS